jgi:Phage integrase family
LKYCPDKRIKCYHAIAASTGARPHEILKLKISDIDWLSDGGFPNIPAEGKTGKRNVTMYFFYKYVKEWIELHPKRPVHSSYLIYSKKTGEMLGEDSLRGIYERDLYAHFIKLLEEPIGQDDRNRIEQLLRKRWNPYVIRHSTITYFTKEGLLSDLIHMNQHFGWSKDSIMWARYQHLAGGESNKYLGEKLGLVASQSKQHKLPKLVECPIPVCRESNNPDAPFCVKCGYPLTVLGYIEKRNHEEEEEAETHQQIESLRNQIQLLVRQVSQLNETVQNYKDDYNWERGWVPGNTPEMMLIKDGSKVNRLPIDALLDQAERTEEDDKKLTKEQRRELQYMRSNSGAPI